MKTRSLAWIPFKRRGGKTFKKLLKSVDYRENMANSTTNQGRIKGQWAQTGPAVERPRRYRQTEPKLYFCITIKFTAIFYDKGFLTSLRNE